MISEIVIVFLLVYITIKEIYDRRERKRLMEMVMAKNLPEFKEVEEKEQSKPKEVVTQPDLMPLDTVSDEQFAETIKREAGTMSAKMRTKDALNRKLGRKVYG